MTLNLLIVEDDASSRAALEKLLEQEGHEVATCATLVEAADRLAHDAFDCILLDRHMPDGDGIEWAVENDWCNITEVVVITGQATVDSAIGALRQGVADYLTKPLDFDRLRAALATIGKTRTLKRDLAEARGELRRRGRFGRMVGRSTTMQSVYDQISRVAPTSASVLIIGESGTGKEVVAETIHELSARRGNALIPVNCGAIPETLIESELFGHEKGSFTGADRSRQGMFERAAGGTLFLDEITEMPVALQVKLLRALETRKVIPVGGARAIEVDVRVLAATNRDPFQAIKDGKLREDLYYRLAVFPIEVPPLRNREGDVHLLAQHFLDDLNREHGTEKVWGDGVLDQLALMRWTGNVRELKNVVQRAFILDDRILAVPQMSETCLAEGSADALPAHLPTASDTIALPGNWRQLTIKQVRDALIARTEERYLRALLGTFGGRIDRTASAAGIGTRALYDAMQRYGLRKEDFKGRGREESPADEGDAAEEPAAESDVAVSGGAEA